MTLVPARGSVPLRRLLPRPASLFLASVLFLSCSRPPPSRVFIPREENITRVSISVSATRVRVDEPVLLFAQRSNAGFVEVSLEDVPEGVLWWRSEPPSLEKEVADNLRWIVEPEGKALFNTDFRGDHTREVRFPEPGSYRITGVSALYGPRPVSSNSVLIEVVE